MCQKDQTSCLERVLVSHAKPVARFPELSRATHFDKKLHQCDRSTTQSDRNKKPEVLCCLAAKLYISQAFTLVENRQNSVQHRALIKDDRYHLCVGMRDVLTKAELPDVSVCSLKEPLNVAPSHPFCCPADPSLSTLTRKYRKRNSPERRQRRALRFRPHAPSRSHSPHPWSRTQRYKVLEVVQLCVCVLYVGFGISAKTNQSHKLWHSPGCPARFPSLTPQPG